MKRLIIFITVLLSIITFVNASDNILEAKYMWKIKNDTTYNNHYYWFEFENGWSYRLRYSWWNGCEEIEWREWEIVDINFSGELKWYLCDKNLECSCTFDNELSTNVWYSILTFESQDKYEKTDDWWKLKQEDWKDVQIVEVEKIVEKENIVEVMPEANIKILSTKHIEIAKNLAKKLWVLDKEYVKNFLLYVIELLE